MRCLSSMQTRRDALPSWGCKAHIKPQQLEVSVASFLEALMLMSFGLSWPINAINAWKARTAKGTSPAFLALITFGYVAGIAAKFVGNNINWVLGVYLFNLAALVVNDLIYLRNRRLDALASRG